MTPSPQIKSCSPFIKSAPPKIELAEPETNPAKPDHTVSLKMNSRPKISQFDGAWMRQRWRIR